MNYIEFVLCACSLYYGLYIELQLMDRMNERAKYATKNRRAFIQTRSRHCRHQFIVSHQNLGLINPPMQFRGKMCLLLLAPNYIFWHTTSPLVCRSLDVVVSNISYVWENRLILLHDFDTLHFDVRKEKKCFFFLHIITFNMVYL